MRAEGEMEKGIYQPDINLYNNYHPQYLNYNPYGPVDPDNQGYQDQPFQK